MDATEYKCNYQPILHSHFSNFSELVNSSLQVQFKVLRHCNCKYFRLNCMEKGRKVHLEPVLNVSNLLNMFEQFSDCLHTEAKRHK
eukprot:3012721-Amphidinium_carterae.1